MQHLPKFLIWKLISYFTSVWTQKKLTLNFLDVEAGKSYVPISLFLSFSMTIFFSKILVTLIIYFKIPLGKNPWVLKGVGSYAGEMS